MSKVTVIGHRPVLDEVVAELQGAGLVQIEANAADVPPEVVAVDDERLRRLDEWCADAGFVRQFLADHHEPTQPFSAFISEKFHVAEHAFRALEPDTAFLRLYRECVAIADTMARGERERARLLALAQELAPWEGLRLEVKELRETDRVVLLAGTVPHSQGGSIRQALRDATDLVTVEELGPVGTRQAWVVMAHRSAVDAVRALLALTDFSEVTFPDLTGYPAEEAARAIARADDLVEEREELIERARELARDDYAAVVALAEAFESKRDALLVRERFGRTERAFVVTGWVRNAQAGELEVALAPWRDSVDVDVAAPGPDDSPPIELDNPRWLRPFETLTDLYGRPRYDEIDPTPILAPFFLLFFSICIGDVGYGLMLIAGAWYIKHRLDVAPGVKRFMDLVMYGGAGSAVFGAATGSYLAISFESLPAFLRWRLFDPMGQLREFLVACVLIGVVQVFGGVLIAAWDAWRRGDPGEAVFGQLSTIFLFASMVVAAAVPGAGWMLPVGLIGTMMMQGRAIQASLGDAEAPAWDRALGWAWLASMTAAVALLASGRVLAGLGLLAGASLAGSLVSRTARGATLSLLGGAYAVYSMTSFVGDVLSYTRLAALGLSSMLVGYAFNLLAGMVWTPAMGLFAKGGGYLLAGVVVALLSAVVFAFGHLFNVVINLLGAFVHPARLQFVEFFSKFYEGGGVPFRPFRFTTKSMVVHAGSAGGEGGFGS